MSSTNSCAFCYLPSLIFQHFNLSNIHNWFINRDVAELQNKMGNCISKTKSHSPAMLSQLAKTYNLTDEQIIQYEKSFNDFDKNGDGKIDADELGHALESMGRKVSKEELKVIISHADKNNSGAIEFDEFVHLIANDTQDAHAHQMFTLFDKDKNGYITPAELKEAMSSLNLKVSDDDIERMMGEADKNGDGQISEREFLGVWQRWVSKSPKSTDSKSLKSPADSKAAKSSDSKSPKSPDTKALKSSDSKAQKLPK